MPFAKSAKATPTYFRALPGALRFMMKIVPAFIGFLLIGSAYSQIIEPRKMDLAVFGSEYLPIVRAYAGSGNFSSNFVRRIKSPHASMELIIQEESDLTNVTYDKSVVKAIVLADGKPVLTMEVHGYSSYNIAWLNEDLIQITNWPGRCVELQTIYSVIESREIYQEGFQHCGV